MTNQAIEPCTHHWKIETPAGRGASLGACIHCGLVRAFPDWMPFLTPEEGGGFNRYGSPPSGRRGRLTRPDEDEG